VKKETSKTIALIIAVFLLCAGFQQVSQIIQTYGSVSPNVGSRPVYSLNAFSNLYARFYNTQLDQLWDENATAMGTGAAVTWANSAVSLTDWESTRGGWLIPVPATITNGWYDVTIYDNGTPAAADTLLLGKHCYIQGGQIQSMDDM